MLSIETRNSYSEVFELLKYTNRKDLEKIPIDLIEVIKENRNIDYSPKIDINNMQKMLSKKALCLYTWLYLEYINKDIQEKNRINKILYDNEIKKQSNLKINNMFEKPSNIKANNSEKIENKQIVIYKQTLFQKIINKIKKFLKFERK